MIVNYNQVMKKEVTCNKNALKIKLPDMILICGFLVAALALFFILRSGGTDGVWAVVRVNGEETERHLLTDSGRYSINGGSNILVIENGSARIEEADCPTQLCVKQGSISRTGQCITCLPNKVTVTVEGGEAEFDAMT